MGVSEDKLSSCFSQPNLFCWDSQIIDELDFVLSVHKINVVAVAILAQIFVQKSGHTKLARDPNPKWTSPTPRSTSCGPNVRPTTGGFDFQ